MKKLLTIAGAATLATSAFALTAFEEEALRIKALLANDGPILEDILEAHKAEWNNDGIFQVWGFTDADSDNVFDDGETRAEVEDMGLSGNVITGVMSSADGTIIIQMTEGGDFVATGTSGYLNNPGFSSRLDGKYVKLIPFQIQLDGTKVVVNDSSSHTAVQIAGYTCQTYEADKSTQDYDLFKANTMIDVNGTTAGGLAERLVSFASYLPAPFDACVSADTY